MCNHCHCRVEVKGEGEATIQVSLNNQVECRHDAKAVVLVMVSSVWITGHLW
jgi:hypothetical protein